MSPFRNQSLACLLLCLVAAAPARAQVGGTFDLTWNSIDCGGASPAAPSTGGVFTVAGTIGQPDAGVLSGGAFSLAGGLWPGSFRPCAADANGDGVITPADVGQFVNTWFASLQAGTLAGDFDHNGQVQPADIALFVATWSSALGGAC